MDRESTLPEIIKHFESLNEIINFSFIEFIFVIDGNISSFYNKLFDEKFQHIPSDNIEEFNDIIKKEENKEQSIKLKSEKGNDIICSIYPILKQKSVTGYLVTQSSSPIDANGSKILSFFSKLTSSLEEKYTDNDINKKHKENLISARNVQAKLYPSFKDVEGLDIASVFLPVEIMSGDFVDAFFIDDNIYQIVTCDITGFDASSSFAGAAIRTLVRSFSSGKTVPSVLLELLVNKLNTIIKDISALIFLTVCQINITTGKSIISSYGDIKTIFYKKNKNILLGLNKTKIGKNFSKRQSFKDISFVLDPSDALFFYCNGAINAPSEDGKMLYGEENIYKLLKDNIESPPIDIVHAMIESIYEFTNYSQIEDNIMLICVKKT